AGFASWDLTELARRLKGELAPLQPSEETLGAPSIPSVELTSLLIELYGPVPIGIEALDPTQLQSDALVTVQAVDPAAVAAVEKGTFPAVQNASLIDWDLSPASFSYLPVALIGQDGCESLLPSNVATQRFQINQVIRTREQAAINARAFDGSINRVAAELAVLADYEATWQPLGHGLGQILYSLPLAPCEAVNIAVIDWVRKDEAQRTDDTQLKDQLIHETSRDRTVGEVVNATLNESQRGSS